MCLIAFAYQQHPDYPLILIANRDEYYARPSRPAHWWQDAPDILGGQDLQASGSWLALQRDGRFAAVTNHRNGRLKRNGELSRGKLIRDYLSSDESAASFSAQLSPELDRYGGFNLLLGDSEGLWYLSNRGGGQQQLAPGLYGLSNAFLDSPWPKTAALKARLANYLQTAKQPDPDALLQLMLHSDQASDDALPDTGVPANWEKMLSSCFIRSAEMDYGTRATTVLLQHRDGSRILLEQNFTLEGKDGRKLFELQPELTATRA